MKKVVNPSLVAENGKNVEIVYDAEFDEHITIQHPSLKLLRQTPEFRDQMENLFDEVFLEDRNAKEDIRLVGSDGTIITGKDDTLTVDMVEKDEIENFLPLIMAAASAAPEIIKLAKGFMPKKKKKVKGKKIVKKITPKVSEETENVEGPSEPEEQTTEEAEEEKPAPEQKTDSLSSILNIANTLAGVAGTDISGITGLAKAFLTKKNADPEYQADLYDTFVRAAKGLDNEVENKRNG